MIRSCTASALSLAFAVGLVACSGATPTTSSVAAPAASVDVAPTPGASLTAAACAASGGEVVGDIGDGAIHRPGYTCPKSGKPPVGKIARDPGKPIPIEGAVCCR